MTDSTRPVTTDTGRFALVPLWLVDAVAATKPRAMGSALAVYVALHRWADFDSGECWPSHQAIGETAGGLSRSTVQEALNLLRSVGAVTWEATTTPAGDPGANRYRVLHARAGSPGGSGEGSPAGSGEGSPGGSGTNESQVNESQGNDDRAGLPDGFAEFWKAYPRKDGRKPAETAWRNLSKRKRVAAMEALPAHTTRWRARGGDWRRFVPHAATWLHQERWADEVAERRGVHADAVATLTREDGTVDLAAAFGRPATPTPPRLPAIDAAAREAGEA